VVVSLVLPPGVISPRRADTITHPSQWGWSKTVGYAAGAGWELDSRNGVYRVIFQADHNLVVYHGEKAIWATNTENSNDRLILHAAMDSLTPGELQVATFCEGGCRFWNSTSKLPAPSYHVIMQNDGNFVEYSNDIQTPWQDTVVEWSTHTKGR
jgi:hypothetical protein